VELNLGDHLMATKTETTRVSQNYVGTYTLSSKAEMSRLDEIKKSVKTMNTISGKKFYVSCKGRSSDGSTKRVGKYNTFLPLSLSDSVDAYIYERSAS
tara:strand:+ start:67 stop:360 length:294 start_codon:yes stop_codon:yes gene_type:complete